MSQCKQYVKSRDRWVSDKQCSRKEKFDTGYCTIHLKKVYGSYFQTKAGAILQECGYDPRFTTAINILLIREYVNDNFAPCFQHLLLQEAVGLEQLIGHTGAAAPANWEWFQNQPRFYATITDVLDWTLEQALSYEAAATRNAMRDGTSYAHYDTQIESYGLDTMPEHEYDEMMTDHQRYFGEMVAYQEEIEKIRAKFREEQIEVITDLREREAKEVAGLIVPDTPEEKSL